jgi:hypothetical protein
MKTILFSAGDRRHCISGILPTLLQQVNLRQLFIVFILLVTVDAFSSNSLQLFAPGAYIVDMGQSPQTVENGLKPYGLVYQLIIVEGIPVAWAINSSKTKDGADFGVNGKQYRGGPFIVAAERLTPSVLDQINTWKKKGVVVDGPVPDAFFAPIYKELTSWPRAVLDAQNDKLVIPFYGNAEVPVTSYTSAGNPTMLTNCGDVYVLPHADPQNWTAESGYADSLKAFVKKDGYLYYSCHAVSALESISGCNFLSNGGLVLWDNHQNGTPPYVYAPENAGDPVMQFLGTLDASTLNGSEEIFLPLAAGWRKSTTIAVYDPDDPDMPGKSPGPAAIVAYGRAFGSDGMVMVNAGHALDQGTLSSRVAAQRAYFNFLLMAGVQKQILINNPVFPVKLQPGATYTLSVNAGGGVGPYSYQWSSSCGGIFSNPASGSTTYTAPASFTECTIKFEVRDACGRINFASKVYTRDSTNRIVNEPGTTPTTATFRDTSGDGHIDRIDLSWTPDTLKLLNQLPLVKNLVQTMTMTTTDGRTITLTPASIVTNNEHGISIIMKENEGPLETGWQTANVILSSQPVSVQGNSLTVTKVVDSAGPVIARAQYRSGTPSGAPDTMIITASELIDCSALNAGKPSSTFVLYDENGRNTDVLGSAVLTGGCPSKYTSTITMVVKSKALVTPSNDSIAFAGGTNAVIDQSGNNPSINNRAVSFEWGSTNELIIGVSTNPFIPGSTEVPFTIRQNYAEVLNGKTIGVVIGVRSSTPLKATMNNDYGKMTIYDAVANTIRSDLPVLKVSPERYGIFWDGLNRNSRRVGTGAYLCVITFNDILGKRYSEKLKVCVK